MAKEQLKWWANVINPISEGPFQSQQRPPTNQAVKQVVHHQTRGLAAMARNFLLSQSTHGRDGQQIKKNK